MEDKNFEELRNQFTILKDQLNKQEIVTDHLLRETMRLKTNDISKTKKITYMAAVFCLLLYPILFFANIWSLAFATATCVMMVFCIVATYYMHRPVEQLNLMRDDLASVASVMARFKRQYDFWLLYVTPLLLMPWLAWACYDFAWQHAPEGVNPWALSLPLIVGAAIGALIGYSYHRKATNAAQDIIDDIEMN